MKIDLGFEILDQFEIEILNNNDEVVTLGGGPFVVTLLSPNSDVLKKLNNKHNEEFAKYVARLSPKKRMFATKPEAMAEKHGYEVMQAAHVAWRNVPPIVDDSGQPVVLSDFKSEQFKTFLTENSHYSHQILRALSEEKNYQISNTSS